MSIVTGQTVLASDFISTSAGGGSVGKVPKLNSNGKLDGLFIIPGKFSNGATTKNTADASTVQTIAHGLGITPTKVKITAIYLAPSGSSPNYANYGRSDVVTDASGTHCIYSGYSNYSNYVLGTATTFYLGMTSVGGYQSGVITMDATNIYITWTLNSSSTGTFQLLWEAQAEKLLINQESQKKIFMKEIIQVANTISPLATTVNGIGGQGGMAFGNAESGGGGGAYGGTGGTGGKGANGQVVVITYF